MNSYSIKKILVGTDLSDTSLNALYFAASIAKEHGACLHILNVTEQGFTSDANRNFRSYSAKVSMNVLSALAASVEQANEVPPKVTQVDGYVPGSIITTAMAEQCDLVILGTHGASGFREGFVGTNAYNVIKSAPCPVLIVPPKHKHPAFKKVLFPVRPTTSALMRYDILGHFLSENSKLDLLGLSYLRMERQADVMYKIAEEIKDHASIQKLKMDVNWGKGISIADDILEHQRQTSPDLILLNSALDASSKLDFIGPQLQRIIHCSTTPILSVKHLGVSIVAE